MEGPELTSRASGQRDGRAISSVSASTGNDEISLFDFWHFVVRRRILIASILCASVVLGLLFTLFVPRPYAYTTVIEVGTIDTSNELIEGPDTVRAKLSDAYIPQVLRDYHENNPEDRANYDIQLLLPKNSHVLVLRSRATADKERVYVALHSEVVNRLQQDHQRILNILRKDGEYALKVREQNLAELRDSAKILAAHLARFDDERALLAGEVTHLRNAIAAATRDRGRLLEQRSPGEATTMTLLILTSEIQHNRTRLMELERQATVGLANERGNLLNKLADNRTAQSEQELEIRALRLKLASLKETKAIASPMRSREPVGMGQTALLILWGLIGLVLGMIGAFLVEFAEKAREQPGRSKAI